MTEIQLQTERLVLINFEDGYKEQYVEIMTDPIVTKFLGDGKNRTKEEMESNFGKHKGIREKYGYGVWLILKKDTEEVIGQCGFLPVGQTGDVELLYALKQSEWGKGYAFEAAKTAKEYAKNIYGWKKLVAFAYPENTGSINVLKKLGFSDDGKYHIFGVDLNKYLVNL